MSVMTKIVSSECSSVSDIDYDPITSTFAKLREVISQEAFLRKELDELFVKRTEDAHIAVQNARNHLEMVMTQEAHMREILKTESAAANEKPEELRIQEEQDAATEEARRAEELAEAARITLACEAARKEAEELAEAESKRIREEEVAEKERQQEAAMIAAVEERRKVEAEKLRLEQEESNRPTRVNEDRFAELEMERLAREEEGRLMAQEASMIPAVEARYRAEAVKRLLEEERWAKQDEDRMQAIAMLDKHLAYVALKKKKKGKRAKEAPAADFIVLERPIVNADAEERDVMEEIKLSEEEKLEAERKQLEAEEAEWLNGTDAKRPDIAEAAEDERTDRELWEEEERRLVAQEEESECLHYLSLEEAAVVAEERLSMIQAELNALEAQKLVIIQQVERTREQEASCCYHEIMRRR